MKQFKTHNIKHNKKDIVKRPEHNLFTEKQMFKGLEPLPEGEHAVSLFVIKSSEKQDLFKKGEELNEFFSFEDARKKSQQYEQLGIKNYVCEKIIRLYTSGSYTNPLYYYAGMVQGARKLQEVKE